MTNREIDALVAEKVMGLKFYHASGEPDLVKVDGKKTDIPKYSTSIEAAWQVVEKIPNMDMQFCGDNWCKVTFGYKGDTFTIESHTAPLAICLAALKAVGVEI